MKLSVALFFAGLFGALAALFVLLSFGTDHWLLASETCNSKDLSTSQPGYDGDTIYTTTNFYHEGFFWRCSFRGSDDHNSLWFWFTEEPYHKLCMPAYLFPFPVSQQTHNVTSYDSAIIYRGFWSVFMLIGVVAVVVGGFVIICAAPFASHRLYKAGGGLFITSGVFLLAVVVMFVLWLEVLDVVPLYKDYQNLMCSDFQLSIDYGLSFMFAPIGIFFNLLAGLLFLLIGRSVQMQYH